MEGRNSVSELCPTRFGWLYMSSHPTELRKQWKVRHFRLENFILGYSKKKGEPFRRQFEIGTLRAVMRSSEVPKQLRGGAPGEADLLFGITYNDSRKGKDKVGYLMLLPANAKEHDEWVSALMDAYFVWRRKESPGDNNQSGGGGFSTLHKQGNPPSATGTLHHSYPPRIKLREDEPSGARTAEEHGETALQMLDEVVGLNNVKEFIKELRDHIFISQERMRLGLPKAQMGTLHMIFKGNPGTGKTTVARVVASMLQELGILRVGHLVESDRSQLVAGFVGQTASKTLAVAKQALGGVLFIDEAYALTRNSQSGGTDFGMEAVDTLVKFMEDNREDLVVILAGYSDEMQEMMRSNPGLKSRFPTVLDFHDYNAEELTEIALKSIKKAGFILSRDAERRLKEIMVLQAGKRDLPEPEEKPKRQTPPTSLQELLASASEPAAPAKKLDDEGNGRFVRNLLEKMYRQQSTRLAQLTHRERTVEDFITILPEDWVYPLTLL